MNFQRIIVNVTSSWYFCVGGITENFGINFWLSFRYTPYFEISAIRFFSGNFQFIQGYHEGIC